MKFPPAFRSSRLLPTSTWARIIIETAVLLGILLIVDAVLKGDRYASMAIHPFGAVVLLMAVQYGLLGGAFATVASIVALFAFNTTAAAAGSDYYDSMAATLQTPTMWLGAAIVFGGLRNLHLTRERMERERRDGAESLAIELSQKLDGAVVEIKSLERRIASDTATVSALITGVAGLDRSSPRAFSASASDILSDVCGASAHAIYAFGAADYRVLAAHDEENSTPATRIMWASRDELVAQFAKSQEAIGLDHALAPTLLVQGAYMMAPIGDIGFVVVERLRAGNTLAGDRLCAVAGLLAAHWPHATGVALLREGAAA